MHEPNLVEGCESVIESLAVIAIIVTALATMVGLVKGADIVKYCGAIVGIAVVLVLIVSVFVDFWSSMSLWQKAVIAAIGLEVWWVRRERHRPRKKSEEE